MDKGVFFNLGVGVKFNKKKFKGDVARFEKIKEDDCNFNNGCIKEDDLNSLISSNKTIC